MSELTAVTLSGLEGVLAEELRSIGLEVTSESPLAVHFRGGDRELARANLLCRTAVRILRPVSRFRAVDEDSLYEGVRRVDWSRFIDPDSTLAVTAVLSRTWLTHTGYAAQLVKDAIVDRFRDDSGRRPSVDVKNPDLRIHIYLHESEVVISLDSSGDSLGKRGHRLDGLAAPIGEVLAAGILALSGWDGCEPLVDAMCGSGTFLSEAAAMARRLPPGRDRDFAFERWKGFDSRILVAEREAAMQEVMQSAWGRIVGSDRSSEAIRAAASHLRKAGVEGDVRLTVSDFADFQPPPGPGVLVMNPPYGERLHPGDMADFHKMIGDALKANFAGYRAFILSGHPNAAKEIGLRPSMKLRLRNGPIDCRLLRYDIYAGSRRARYRADSAG